MGWQRRAPARPALPGTGAAMNGLDAGQLGLLKDILQRRLAEPGAGTGANGQAGGRDLPVQEVETSPADKATVRLLNDLALEAAGQSAAGLRSVRQALAKFEAGTYGECEDCGAAIGFSRLQARPEARMCIACQTRAEKR